MKTINELNPNLASFMIERLSKICQNEKNYNVPELTQRDVEYLVTKCAVDYPFKSVNGNS